MRISYFTARRIFFTLFVATALTSLGSALTATDARSKYNSLAPYVDCLSKESSEATEETQSPSCSLLIRAHNGIIGVFEENGTLLYTVDVHIMTLPEKDRLLLEQGISAASYDELLEILGDYDA
ncbi:MAG: hypothetical protein IKB23_05580 [Clostridia bacterium]|nr:hypothetical protein [Clostridia bacterium]